ALLFQPFQQLDSSHARRHDGTGLGLAISRRLVELMGGSMGLSSSPGSGSTFWFLLPIRPASDPLHTPGLRVLVVRDHELTRRISLLSLERLGCHAEAAASGSEAIARCRAGGLDAVVFDIRQPDMEGTALASELRSLDPRIRLIALADDASEEMRRRLTASGVNVVLSDPPPIARLREALNPSPT
ncbi:MAG: response regulator, partial [Verrucomicrobiales bacterium]|nr:response regulator [Verrucomicrobiales bacterium]